MFAGRAPLWLLLWMPVYRRLSNEQRAVVSGRVLRAWALALNRIAASFLTATEAARRFEVALRTR